LAAEAPGLFDKPFLPRRYRGHRPPRRRLRRARQGAGRTGLAADHRSAAPRHARHHRDRAGRTAGPHGVGHELRPPGAALPHAAQAVCPRGALGNIGFFRGFLTFDRRRLGWRPATRCKTMAKATTIKVKLVSSADTGFYYVTRKNSRTMTDKLVKKKYDPVAKKHVEFRESKIK